MDFDTEVLQNDVDIVITFMLGIEAFYSLAEDVSLEIRLVDDKCSVPLTYALDLTKISSEKSELLCRWV